MHIRAPAFTYASTDHVAAEDRLAYWDKYNADALIGLSTTSSAVAGLQARQANSLLDGVLVAAIDANQHVVDRSPELVRQFPKESVFACHLVNGDAYFNQNGQSFNVHAAETILYDTRQPFTFGFRSDMRELLVDLPISYLREHWDIDHQELPLKVSPINGVGAMLGAELRRLLTGYLRSPTAETAESLPERTHTLMRSMIRCCKGDANAIDRSVFYVIAAKDYIAQKLSDPELCASDVANKIGLSVRHLNRLFAKEQTSLTEYLWAQRAARAHRELLMHKGQRVLVGEIAFRWGFSSQAHFCRTIVSRYGATPSEILKSSTEQPPTSAWHYGALHR